ncbi:DUF4924 family protein [Marinilabiliaceae bacterium JC017]|nr:DUF4924 family protein [Marinilabiliaceae bacterium JC017]
MIIAHQKKQENIIEYILYMWQVEDLARAHHLDMSEIEKHVLPQYKQPEETLLKIRDWWDNLIAMLINEKKEKSGHLQVNINTLNDVHQLHLKLMNAPNEISYRHLYNSVLADIKTFNDKTNQTLGNDIEICLTAIYSTFLLKLQGKEISNETTQAVKGFSKFLALLAVKYKKDQEGELDLD